MPSNLSSLVSSLPVASGWYLAALVRELYAIESCNWPRCGHTNSHGLVNSVFHFLLSWFYNSLRLMINNDVPFAGDIYSFYFSPYPHSPRPPPAPPHLLLLLPISPLLFVLLLLILSLRNPPLSPPLPVILLLVLLLFNLLFLILHCPLRSHTADV